MEKPSNEIIEKNKELLSKWPWLENRNVFDNEPTFKGEEKYYFTTWNEWDNSGWEKIWKKFLTKIGEIWEKLPEGKAKQNFKILDSKEKFGSLRVFLGGYFDDKMRDLESALMALSSYTCIKCGKQPRNSRGERIIWNSKGWICPYCKDCAKKLFFKNKKYYKDETTWKSVYDKYTYKGKFKITSFKNGKTETRELEDL